MKTIGLIGGTSWESTRIYYELLNRDVKARLGGLHSADLLLASIDFAPIAASMAAAEWSHVSECLVLKARALERAGAECIALAANTMHKCAPAVAAAVRIPFIHIVDVVSSALTRDSRSRPLLLGTRFTMEDGFFQQHLAQLAVHALVPDAKQRTFLHATIFEELCQGIVTESARQTFLAIIEEGRAAGADSVILGCTEFGMLLQPADSPLPAYETAALHAAALVDFALSKAASQSGA